MAAALGPDEVHVWMVKLDAMELEWEAAFQLIDPAERARVLSFRRIQDR